jgi:hypothetical protein
MGRGKGWPRRADGKCKRPPSPPSEDFGDSEYSKEVSSEYNRSPALASIVASSEDPDDSMGLSTVARAYWRSIEHARLSGSDDSEETSSEEVEDSSNSEEWSGGEGDGDEDDGSSDDDNGNDGGDDDGEGGDGEDGDSEGDVDGKGDGDGNGSGKNDGKGDGDGKGNGEAGNIMLLA